MTETADRFEFQKPEQPSGTFLVIKEGRTDG
jgi:hypothetical protein